MASTTAGSSVVGGAVRRQQLQGFSRHGGDYTTNGIPGHLTNQMHLYGSSDGRATTGVYVPGGYDAVYPNPRANPGDRGRSFVFFYSNLNGLQNVSLVATHVANLNVGDEGGRVRIGDTGGPGEIVGMLALAVHKSTRTSHFCEGVSLRDVHLPVCRKSLSPGLSVGEL